MQIWIGGTLIVYLAVMVGLGIYAQSKVETEEDYLVAGRRLPLWLAWGTLLATWFGAATVLGASQTAREEGLIGTVLDPFASAGALIVAGLFFARPLWNRKLLTTGDLFAQAYGPRTEVVSSLVQAAGYVPWIAAQYIALATLLNHYFAIPVVWGVILSALFVLFLTMSGGMWSVTLTDTLQILLVLIGLVILTFVMMSRFGNGDVAAGVRNTWNATPPEHRTLLPPPGVVALMFWSATWFNGILGNIPGQDLMQRVFASKSAKTASHACLLAGGVYLLFGLLPVMLGLGSRLMLPEHDSDGILFALADALLSVPMTCLFVVSLVSIIVSTCTSALLSPSALIGHNLMRQIPATTLSHLIVDRGAVVLVTACSIPLAFAGQDILDLLDVAFEISLIALFFPFTMGLFGRPKSDLSGLLSILLGLGVWLVHRYGAWPDQSLIANFPTEFSGTLASVIGYFVGQTFSQSIPKETANRPASTD